MHRVYDPQGNNVEFIGFGLDGKPTVNNSQTAGWRARYDARGNNIEQSFFGADGAPALSKTGFAAQRQVFDTRSNLIERTFYGIDGEPVALPDGYAKIVWAYDARDDVIEESFFDATGKPANKSGCVSITYTYDDTGRETGVTYLDAQNHPMQVDVAVSYVLPGENGAANGVMPGDHILAYNGHKVTSIKGFEDMVNKSSVGRLILTVQRGAEIQRLSVSPGALAIGLELVRADTQQAVLPVAPKAN